MLKSLLLTALMLASASMASARPCENWLTTSVMGMSPRIETERLVLRNSNGNSLEKAALKELLMTPDVRREYGTEGIAERFYELYIHRATIGSFRDEYSHQILLGVFDKSSNETLGLIGMAQDTSRSDLLKNAIGISYSLLPEARGRGFISEALSALMGDVERQTPEPVFYLFIADENTASLNVAARMGFRKLRRRHALQSRTYHIYVSAPALWMDRYREELMPKETSPNGIPAREIFFR